MNNRINPWSTIAWFFLMTTIVGNSVFGQETPVEIGSYRNLFVDSYLISSMSNLNRQVHQPTRSAQNPLVGPTEDWEQMPSKNWEGLLFPFIDRDESTGKFRMWYAGACRYDVPPSGVSARFPGCYAESDDGINWTKPNLGLHSFNGSTANNIIIPGGNIWGVIKEPDDPDPNRRYKAMVWHEPQYSDVEGYFIYTSPDGIHWNRETPLNQPVLESATDYSGQGIGDTSSFRWDPMLNKYVGDVKLFPGTKFRISGQVESDDLINWTEPVVTIQPDAYDLPDTQIYQQRGFNYEGQWLGLTRIYHEDLTPSYKQTTVELTSSRDGRTWERVGTQGIGEGRQEFMSVDDDGSWDDNYHDPCTPIQVGDELWIFYRSTKLGVDKTDLQTYQIGLATLRLDGFVSLDADEVDAGEITTVPLLYDGDVLLVNADIAEGGYLKAELLDADGNVLEGFSMSDCNALTGDVLAGRITWADHELLANDAIEGLRLRFEMKDAQLYSFCVTPEPGTLAILGVGMVMSAVSRRSRGTPPAARR